MCLVMGVIPCTPKKIHFPTLHKKSWIISVKLHIKKEFPNQFIEKNAMEKKKTLLPNL
jgi:hypothetical protein